MTEVHDLAASELARHIRARRLSPIEVVTHYLRRIAGDDVGGYVTVAADQALERAVKAEQELMSADPADLPALHGVPVPVKDLYPVAGLPLGRGSAAAPHGVARHDDGVVTRLREAGAVLIGTTNTPEFGLPCYAESDVAPPARTPWDLSRSAGGSSGGAAAAVAAGLAPVAHGSDGGGSIRIPASACGVVGLKPARGTVSNGPHGVDLLGLVGHGSLARTVTDAALLLDAMAGTEPGDIYPTGRAEPYPPGHFVAATTREPAPLRIAVHHAPAAPDTAAHPDCLAALAAAAGAASRLGHHVEQIDAPFGTAFMALFTTLWIGAATVETLTAEQQARLRPLTRWLRDRGRALPAAELLSAHARLQRMTRGALAACERYDAVLTPTLAAPPVSVGYFADAPPADDFARQCAFTPYCSVHNVTGWPAVSLPLYWNAAGLPIGVQLACRDEVTLLGLAAQFERALPWTHRRPPCW